MLFGACNLSIAALAAAGNGSQGENSGSSGQKIFSTSESDDNYLGDGLSWDRAIEAIGSDGHTKYCIPSGTVLIGETSSPDPTKKALEIRLETQSFPYFGHFGHPENVRFPEEKNGTDTFREGIDDGEVGPNNLTHIDGLNEKNEKPDQAYAFRRKAKIECDRLPDSAAGFQNLPEGTVANVDAELLPKAARTGWEYGILAIPFKLQLAHGKALTSTATGGGYVGVRLPIATGFVLSPIIFGGGSSVLVTNTDSNNKTTSQNLLAASLGGGLIFSIKNSFHAGIVAGVDHVDSNVRYRYNNKWWLSFEIGYSLAQ